MVQTAIPSQFASGRVRVRARHLSVAQPGTAGRGPAQPGVAQRGTARRGPVEGLHPSVYRRRRILAAGLLLLSVAALAMLAQLIQVGISGGPLSVTGAAAGSPTMIAAGTRDYVVQPGDTLWTIAERVDPNGDERPLVDALQRQLGSTDIYPGEHIAIPAHW